MPKKTTDYSIKLKKYCLEYKNVVSIDGNNLLCNVCKKYIKNPFRKYSVKQHFVTLSHCRNLIDFNKNSVQNTVNENEKIFKQIYCEKQLNSDLENDLNNEKVLLSILESIKDKVRQLLNECKCVYNISLKNETKELLEKYERIKCRKTEPIDSLDSVEEYSDNNSSEFETKYEPKQTSNTLITKNGEKRVKSEQNYNKSQKRRNLLKSLNNKVICHWPGCELILSSNTKLKSHMKSHFSDEVFSCEEPNCGKTYKSYDLFEVHIQTHKKVKNLAHICDWIGCEKKFISKLQLTYHKKSTHMKDNYAKYLCEWPECAERFLTRVQLDSHISQSHMGYNLYKCNLCDKTYPNNGNLNRHKRMDHLLIKNYKCDYEDCGERFSRKEELIRHRNRAHNCTVGMIFCDWPGCDFSSSLSGQVKKHKRKHTDERPYMCSWPQCGSRFRQNHHLIVHMRKHTGERPYKCDNTDCQMSFQSKQSMRFHFERKHKN